MRYLTEIISRGHVGQKDGCGIKKPINIEI
jgi:hypothetical protein